MKIRDKLVGLVSAGVVAFGLSTNANADYIRTTVSSSNPNVIGSQMNIEHYDGSLEGEDSEDNAWGNLPGKWMRISTSPYNVPLNVDSRGLESKTAFNSVVDAIGGSFTADNTKFYFQFLEGPDVIPDYNYSITAGSFTETGSLLDRVNNHDGYTGSFTYDSSIGATLTLTPVDIPEPSTAWLLGIGAAAVGAYCARRGRKEEKRE